MPLLVTKRETSLDWRTVVKGGPPSGDTTGPVRKINQPSRTVGRHMSVACSRLDTTHFPKSLKVFSGTQKVLDTEPSPE